MTKEELYAQAAVVAGRPVEVEQTTGGQFIVLWMCFEKSPPSKADTEEGALENFIREIGKTDSSGVVIPADAGLDSAPDDTIETR